MSLTNAENDVSSCDLLYEVGAIDFEDFVNCPEDYKNFVIRILSMQAYAELMGANEVGYQLKLAPDYKARKRLAKIAYDEASHAYLLYDILHRLNISESEAVNIAEGKTANSAKTASLEGVLAVGHDDNTWLDIILNNFFLDRAGSYMVNNFSHSSFKPWSQACKSIYKDELWHIRFGNDELEKFINENSLEKVKGPFAIWYVRALNFFGPPTSRSQELLKRYGIKRQTNSELRDKFVLELHAFLREKSWFNLLPQVSPTYPYHVLA